MKPEIPSQINTKIGFIALQSNKHRLLFYLLLFLGVLSLSAQEDKVIPLTVKKQKDSIVAPLIPADIINKSQKKDSITQDSSKTKEPLLVDLVKRKAEGYMRYDRKEQKIYLYDKAELYYQDTELKAGIIIMDLAKNEVYAGRIKDSTGVYSQLPDFKQGSQVVKPDSIRFNFDTQKALIWNSRTEQQAGLGSIGSDAMKVYAEKTKKENDSVYFMSRAKITTSNDTINPDYYILVNKVKFVPGKKMIAGYSNMYIADVPTPIALPFAYFPMTTGNTAGLIFPTFGSDPDRGYFLQNGGYYFPINEFVDLTLQGDFYTNGSYGFRGQSTYIKRYKYRGNVNIRYENQINSQKGFEDYSRSTNYNIQISHTQDPKNNPNSRLSASVNLGSSDYYRSSLNQYNVPNTQNNNLSSSVSYSKTFPEYPSVNLSLTATHNQNTNTDVINLTLPTMQASMERIFPFAKRDGLKKGIIQNINFQYDVNAQNQITTSDSLFFKSEMFDDAKVGARHRIPVSTNFKVFKQLSVSLGGSYEDIWTLETYDKFYDADTDAVISEKINGFDRYNKYSFSASLGTTMYGTWTFDESKNIQAIRHTMRPSIGYSYSPSFEETYDEYMNADGEYIQYSRFEGTLNGAPGLTQSSSLSFSLQNTLEAKVKDRDSTATEPKKISLLSSFNISTNYNFQADSLRLSPFRINGGTTILNKKMSINFSANLDPYAIDNKGTRINTLNINNGGSLARLTSARANIGYSLSSKMFDKKEDEDDEDDDDGYVAASGGRTDDLFGRSDDFSDRPGNPNDEDEEVKENPLYKNAIPWDVRLAYAVSYSNPNRQDEISNHSLMFSGNVDLTPRWKVGVSSGYDFKNQGFSLTQLRFERDLKSFRLNFNWTPFGTYERWYFFIGIKSSILKDLKWEQRSQR
ncbi:MAG: putative LPS assembly protein LptD [Cellulophaga sp.]